METEPPRDSRPSHEAPSYDHDVGDVILDRYAITKVLGRGGMGYVLAAEDRRLDRRVALKFLLAPARNRPDIAARFEGEARTATKIVDEHVARVHTVEVTPEGESFIVMEHLEGKDLYQVIRARGPLPTVEAVDWVLQACEALAQAHKLGIVHRDLKPSNLFLTKTFDGTPIVKVLDFGIAKATRGDETPLTATEAFIGTPAYMSPEQLSAEEVDARSDVWALGVILYELLTAAPPFTGASVSLLTKAILNGDFADLPERADIPPSLEQAVALAINIDLEHRTPSVEAFAAQLALLGTDRARASYERIRRVAFPSEPAGAPVEPPNAPEPLVGVGATSVDRPTSLTKGDSQPQPRNRRALQAVLGAVAAAAVVLGVVRYRTTPTQPTITAATPEPAPVESAAAETKDTSPCAAGATPACEAACAAHQPGSCRELAIALAKGLGAPKDLTRAIALYKADCEAGSGDSCNRLGGHYERGEGVTQDDAQAFNLYDKGCLSDSAAACVNRGTMYWRGKGVGRNDTEAAISFQRGCDGGEPAGCLNASVAYHDGRGVQKDLERAYEFADRACTGGTLEGCTLVGAAKVLGEGVAKDVKGGLAQLNGLCKRKEASACDKYEGLYAKGVGTDVPADPLRVREAAKRACAAGSGQDCKKQELLDTVDRTSANPARGFALFETKCDAGMMSACGMLGEALYTGSLGGAVDRTRGKALREKACNGGYKPACKALGTLERGDEYRRALLRQDGDEA